MYRLHNVLVLFIALTCCESGWTSEKLDTGDFADVRAKAIELGARYGNNNVLLVFDIDNTILAMQQDLGSDQWFDWQSDLLKSDPRSPHLVSKDFSGLLRAQGLLFALSDMRPTHPKQPTQVAELQDRGFAAVLLTSRAPNYRDATEREVEQDYDFSRTEPDLNVVRSGEWLPFDAKDFGASGITSKEADAFGLTRPGAVSYDDGIYMTSGQHKGAMLLMLLAQATRRFSAVVFVDDRQKHTDNVFNALRPRGYDVVVFRYGREDENVDQFEKSDKKIVVDQWGRLQHTIQSIFGDASDDDNGQRPNDGEPDNGGDGGGENGQRPDGGEPDEGGNAASEPGDEECSNGDQAICEVSPAKSTVVVQLDEPINIATPLKVTWDESVKSSVENLTKAISNGFNKVAPPKPPTNRSVWLDWANVIVPALAGIAVAFIGAWLTTDSAGFRNILIGAAVVLIAVYIVMFIAGSPLPQSVHVDLSGLADQLDGIQAAITGLKIPQTPNEESSVAAFSTLQVLILAMPPIFAAVIGLYVVVVVRRMLERLVFSQGSSAARGEEGPNMR